MEKTIRKEKKVIFPTEESSSFFFQYQKKKSKFPQPWCLYYIHIFLTTKPIIIKILCVAFFKGNLSLFFDIFVTQFFCVLISHNK